ncbi:NAD(+) synthase [Candidatus Woesearchaeota archaeon]|nr:NAD(+) synthase [Candidatus Woesearchaeota archaeon]
MKSNQYNNLERRIKLARMNPELVAREIGDFIISEVLNCGYSGVVIGLSGGVDSSTTAALAKKAFDGYNKYHPEKPLEVKAYMLPSNVNDPSDKSDAVRVAEMLKIKYETIDIQPVVDAYAKTNPEAIANNYDKGNLMSRIRANILSTKASSEKKLVIGTGNKDEDFGVGYYTLFGDGAVHLSPIGGLPKRLVREMAKYLGLPKELVHRTPAAGLEPGQTDFKDLGYDYDVVELVMQGIAQGSTYNELIMHRQIRDMVEPQIAMQKNPKHPTVRAVVYDILRRNRIAQVKARIIHPPTPDITLNYD